MKCWIVIVQRGDGGIRELEVEAVSKQECERFVAETLPGVRIVRTRVAFWSAS